MILVAMPENQRAEYNQFVATEPTGSFLQSWDWGQWQSFLGKTIFRFKITDEHKILGVIQFIKMPLPFGKYYLYAPYGPVLVEGFVFSNLEFIFEESKKIFPDAVFFRLEPKSLGVAKNSLGAKKTKNIQPGKTLVLDLQKTEEQLLSGMHHKTRYNIKLAQKHGVVIQDEFVISIGNGLFAKEAVGLIVATAHRQGFKTFRRDYYEQLVSFFGVQNRGELKLHIYKALLGGELLASAIMIDFGSTRTYLFGGSADNHKNVMAPYLLHWQAITEAKKLGLKVYDFWGSETAAGDSPGFVRFKFGFGGQELSFGGAYDFIINKPQYGIYRLLRKLNKLRK